MWKLFFLCYFRFVYFVRNVVQGGIRTHRRFGCSHQNADTLVTRYLFGKTKKSHGIFLKRRGAGGSITLHLLGGGVQESVWSSWCSPVMDPVGDSYLLFGALQQFSVLRPVHTQEKRVNDKHQSIFSLALGVNGPLRQQQDDRSAGFQLYGQRKVGANKSWPSSRCEAKLSEKEISFSSPKVFANNLPFFFVLCTVS